MFKNQNKTIFLIINIEFEKSLIYTNFTYFMFLTSGII